MARWVKHSAPEAGIYYLMDGETVMYVGQSKHVPTRINQHGAAGKPFTHWDVEWMPDSTEAERLALERAEIRRFDPPWNYTSGPYISGPAYREMVRRQLVWRRWRRVFWIVAIAVGIYTCSDSPGKPEKKPRTPATDVLEYPTRTSRDKSSALAEAVAADIGVPVEEILAETTGDSEEEMVQAAKRVKKRRAEAAVRREVEKQLRYDREQRGGR